MIRTLTIFAALLLMALPALAQKDKVGKLDTLYADVAKVNDFIWTITVSYTNDENVVGLSVPLKLNAGLTRIVADSAIYTGGRVDHFALKSFRADTAIQCVTLGMVATLSSNRRTLLPGSGRLVTVFVSSADKQPIGKLTADTTTTNPSNSLMAYADSLQGIPPDTNRIACTPGADNMCEIYPAFVTRQVK